MTMNQAAPVVAGVSKDRQHLFSKQPCGSITLLEGPGVEGDAHAGITVQHRSRVAADPTQPNLRQVHLTMLNSSTRPASTDTNWPQGTLARTS